MIEIALLLNVLFFVGVILFLVTHRYMNIYSGLFVYAIFHYVVFVQRPFLVYLFDMRTVFERLTYFPTPGEFAHTLFVADLGFLSFTFFYLAALRFTSVTPNFNPPVIGYPERAAFGVTLVILGPLILYSFFLAFTVRQAYGGEVLDQLGQLNLQVDPATGQLLYVDSTAYIVDARNFALPFATLLIVLQRGRWWSWPPLLLCALVSLQVGARWPLVISVLVTIFLATYLRKRRFFEIKYYMLMAPALFAFVVVGQNRDALVKLLLTGNFDLNFDLSQSSFGDHPDFAMFDCLSYVLAKVPAVSGTYSYFTQYLGLFTQAIPRALWPDKPVGSPIMLVNLDAYGKFSPYVPTLVGDGWISLGYAGVIITTGLVGAFYGWLYRRFCRGTPSIYFFCAYFLILALLLQWARDGGYGIITNFFFFCIGPILLAYGVGRVSFKRPREFLPKQSQ
jgi:oligosaccharide repeat unit polymerase